MDKSDLYHFTFLRHGQSEGNVQILFQGQRDYPLTDLGRQQATQLGEIWKQQEKRFDRVIASPLSRARETAEIVAGQLQLPVELEPLWMEQDFGDLSHRSIPEYIQSPDRPQFFNLFSPAGSSGESRMDLIARAGQAVQSLFKLPAGRYLVVSHGALLNAVLYVILGIQPHADTEGPRFIFKNTSYAHLTYDPGRHRWQLRGINRRPHFEDQEENRPEYELTLLRHGQSEGNREGRWQGQRDYPLTDTGRQQALALGQYWQQSGWNFDQIIASPLSRARETAQIIADHIQREVELDPIWMERNNGELAGLDQDGITARGWTPEYLHPYVPVGENGESEWELYLRAGRGLNRVMRRGQGRYLVVGHGGTLNMTLRALLGIAPQAFFRGAGFAFGNTGYARLSFHPSQNQWRFWAMDNQEHLE